MLCEKCGHEHEEARQADNGGYYGFEVSCEVPEKYLTPLQYSCTRSSLCTLRPLVNVRAVVYETYTHAQICETQTLTMG